MHSFGILLRVLSRWWGGMRGHGLDGWLLAACLCLCSRFAGGTSCVQVAAALPSLGCKRVRVDVVSAA
jgi:hypothetical protein